MAVEDTDRAEEVADVSAVLPDPEVLRSQVREKCRQVAAHPADRFHFHTGRPPAARLGYDQDVVDALPDRAVESFAGVGNPFSLGQVRSGQTVLDLGCGAGMDALLAARQVGPAGKVVGVDLVEEMLAKARRNAAAAGVSNAEFLSGSADALPVPEGTVDVVISNGVFNLCADKPRVVAEMFRVLRVAGRLQMADILLEPQVTPEDLASKGTWSD